MEDFLVISSILVYLFVGTFVGGLFCTYIKEDVSEDGLFLLVLGAFFWPILLFLLISDFFTYLGVKVGQYLFK